MAAFPRVIEGAAPAPGRRAAASVALRLRRGLGRLLVSPPLPPEAPPTSSGSAWRPFSRVVGGRRPTAPSSSGWRPFLRGLPSQGPERVPQLPVPDGSGGTSLSVPLPTRSFLSRISGGYPWRPLSDPGGGGLPSPGPSFPGFPPFFPGPSFPGFPPPLFSRLLGECPVAGARAAAVQGDSFRHPTPSLSLTRAGEGRRLLPVPLMNREELSGKLPCKILGLFANPIPRPLPSFFFSLSLSLPISRFLPDSSFLSTYPLARAPSCNLYFPLLFPSPFFRDNRCTYTVKCPFCHLLVDK